MDDLESDLQGYLRSGEHLRWTGRPTRGLRLSSRDGFLIPFSLLWLAFAVFWEVTAGTRALTGPGIDRPPVALVFPLFGAAFVLFGLYIAIGRFLVDAWVRRRMTYAVTDRRVLVLRRIFSDHLITLDLGGEVQLTRERGGRGTIEFGPQAPWQFGRTNSWSTWTPALSGAASFIGIDDVMTVYGLVNRDPEPAPYADR